MSIALTPEMLEAAYEYLRVTPPFRGWKLPHADSIEFRVISTMGYTGAYFRRGRRSNHVIELSGLRIGSTDHLLETLAHEMIHLYQGSEGLETPNTEHNAMFKRLARRVCKTHGWDHKAF